MYEFYFQQIERIRNLNEKKALLIFQFFKYIIWQPRMKNKWIKRANCLAEMLIKENLLTSDIRNEFSQLIHTQVQQRMDTILPTFIEVIEN